MASFSKNPQDYRSIRMWSHVLAGHGSDVSAFIAAWAGQSIYGSDILKCLSIEETVIIGIGVNSTGFVQGGHLVKSLTPVQPS